MLNKIRQIIIFIQYNPGMGLSILLHLILFSFILVGLPQCKRNTSPPEVIISVDLLPIASKSNIENKQATPPKPPKEQEKPIEKPKLSEKEPEPKTIQEEKKIEPIKQDTAPIKEEKKEIKKIQEPKKIEKKKKPAKNKVSEYDSLLKTLEETVKNNDQKEKVEKTTKGPTNADQPLSLSIKDSIKRQIEQCWNPPAGNKDAGKLQILLNITLNSDGSIANVKIVDTIKYNNDDLYKVAADAAVRAVHKCSPLQDLPVAQYNLWKSLELNFDPSHLIY